MADAQFGSFQIPFKNRQHTCNSSGNAGIKLSKGGVNFVVKLNGYKKVCYHNMIDLFQAQLTHLQTHKTVSTYNIIALTNSDAFPRN